MPFFKIRPPRVFALAACLLAAASLTAQEGHAVFAKLEVLQATPDSAGTLIYRGNTFAQRSPTGAPLYRYERRVLATPKGLSASHITSDSAGRVVIVESAVVSLHYELQRFEATNQQSSFTVSVPMVSFRSAAAM